MRRIFILLCCIMLMIAFACSASAYSVGWEDHVITTGIDRDGNFYSVAKFPSDDTTIIVSDVFTTLKRVNSTSLTYTFPANSTPYWIVYPLGLYGETPNFLALQSRGNNTQGIPNGTHLLFDISISYSASQLTNATMIFDIDFYDANYNYISYERLENEVGNLPYTWQVEYTMNAPPNAVFAVPYISMRSSSRISSAMSFGVSVGNLMLELDLKFEDWRNTMDDINQGINGPANPVDPDNLPSSDLEDQENFFSDLGHDLLGPLADMLDSITARLSTYGYGFLVISALFSAMLQFEVVDFLLNLSVSLGILAFILNITPSIVDKFHRGKFDHAGKEYPK